MTQSEIELAVKEIRERAKAGDYEVAHSLEDELYWEFVKYIAKTDNVVAAKKAKMVLKTQKIVMSRWYA